ncbi:MULTISPECIES: tRNA (guanosine(46)-N7)-methyltransferase TrmB [unclassified Fusibacter]|uniref:tRNA (guanosine(46)-N7)-methyltransferase TrmB n=1 Tax=unclassified Fusibacter TaxID=2624464 RepID=UPI0010106B89|nr:MULTISPECIES: tRNA (guanosine(46)-N7)-methyltransferase TrmB [unclassified Fusibacter]MCK8059469.1 tRNA (guanosine(46)-N7)-methyltransferase TrmB [Fusibacter sp. A2]NPE21067.1 tRNA (guanosine(46)-N7)-methyltransferase TrmB [Fusibacter sp. A1]RXV62341.1 tRNA (guanosine(46)-N7)-methyltransferase TrmB [Fusibacter sp. A1]
MRLRKIPGAFEAYMSNVDYALDANSELNDKLKEFIAGEKVYLEIGTGRGGFLTEMAKRHPEAKFIGVELREEVLLTAVEKAIKKDVTNIKFIRGNALEMKEWFGELKVDGIFLNFSDPWPKARHAKRRLTHFRFLDVYKDIIAQDGKLIFKTDNKALYEFSLESLNEHLDVVEHTDDLHALNDESNVMTEYERRFAKRGFKIHRIIAKF